MNKNEFKYVIDIGHLKEKYFGDILPPECLNRKEPIKQQDTFIQNIFKKYNK